MEITTRQTRLNIMAASIEPQILSEEIVELRLRRIEIEDRMVNWLSKSTGVSATECRMQLMRHKWNIRVAAESMEIISIVSNGLFFGEFGHKYHFCHEDSDAKTITAICGFTLQKKGGYKEARTLLKDHVCPHCVQLGSQINGVENVQAVLRALPEVSKVS